MVGLVPLFCDIPWPACSSDLAASGIFLWVYLKSEECATRPSCMQEANFLIPRGIGTNIDALLHRIVQDFARLQDFIECRGGNNTAMVMLVIV